MTRKQDGILIRPEILQLIQAGETSCKEAILLSIIDSISKDGVCDISNEVLGQFICLGERMTRKTINQLVEDGWLVFEKFDGRARSIRLDWDAIQNVLSPDGKKIPGREEKKYRADRKENTGRAKNISSPLKGEVYFTTPGRGAGNRKIKQRHSHPRWRRFAEELAEAISTVRKINFHSKLNGWAESFRKLHYIDGVPVPNIKKVLKWYCAQIRQGDLIRDNSKYLPVAYSGAAFREKYLRIEDAMRKAGPKEEPDQPRFRVEKDDSTSKHPSTTKDGLEI